MAHILVVDDEEAIQEVLLRQLRGHHVVTVGSADDALAYMAVMPVDMVFCDVIMPVHNGLWLLEQIRVRWPAIVVIMVSSAEEIKTVQKARELGAIDYVPKPIGREMLHQALGRALAILERRRIP